MIEISVKAQSYLKDLLSQQEDNDVGIRVFVSDPGTPSAEACIAYCRPGEEEEGGGESEAVDIENAEEESSKDEVLNILRSHPKLAVEKKLTEHSNQEQSRANLKNCTQEEFNEFTKLNSESLSYTHLTLPTILLV